MNTPLSFEPFADILHSVQAVVPGNVSVYLVGGAVRDALLAKPIRDLDFVVSSSAIPIARRFANKIGAAFFPLDNERDTGRAIVRHNDEELFSIDFASFRGETLEGDLRDRDLTINAMALDINDLSTLFDPLGGARDLENHILRACSSNSFQNDAIRILRAVRLAVGLGFQIHPESKQAMRANKHRLNDVSQERVRDELFHILEGPKSASAIRILDLIGALPIVLPELNALKGVLQSPPHLFDVWNHSLAVLRSLSDIVNTLSFSCDQDLISNWRMGLVSLQLGRYRQQIDDHFHIKLNPQRSLFSLLCFASLFHDIAKPQTRSIDNDGRIRFFNHSQLGAALSARRAEQLRLSQQEIHHLQTIIKNHMRPFLLSQSSTPPSRKAIYRYFRDTKEAGVDICLLSLADLLGTYGASLPENVWSKHLDITRILLQAWWDYPEEIIYPPSFLNGNDLQETFGLSPGEIIGRLLESIKEAQAIGEIHSKEEALDHAKRWLIDNDYFFNNQG